ncbi:MAG: peroxidase-related enzyme [Gammaproteobacteria bacterium]|nr:peroxidase-related enzyme [Gammaproteobacteria bacterium]
MKRSEHIYALDLKERNNLDAEMTALVKGIEKKYGFMPHFIRLFATDNRRLRAFMGQYMELLREDSGLTHLEHEMIALVSAATNGCVYCTAHHGALMRGETGDALFAEYLSRNYKMAALSTRHRAMLDFAVKVLTQAEHITDEDRQVLRQVGFDDEAIWMIISTAAFYASANRIAQATGLQPASQYLEMYRAPTPTVRAKSTTRR